MKSLVQSYPRDIRIIRVIRGVIIRVISVQTMNGVLKKFKMTHAVLSAIG